MGEMIKRTGNEAVKRWHEKMPRFFHTLMMLAVGIGTTASAIHFGLPALGSEHSEWWPEVYKWICGICIGVAVSSKFTVDGGFRQKQADKMTSYDKEQHMED